MVQVSKVSFEYVDFHAKMSLIFYPAFGNSITKRTLMYILFNSTNVHEALDEVLQDLKEETDSNKSNFTCHIH